MSIKNFLLNRQADTLQEKRKRELAEFLTATLQVQQSPPNPLPKWIGRILMLLCVFAVVWATVGKVDVVATAEGKIIPGNRVKQIQSLETALVREIYVKEGQRVDQGELLVALDSTMSHSDAAQLQQELQIIRLQLATRQLFYHALQDNFLDSNALNQLPNDSAMSSVYVLMVEQQWQQFKNEQATMKSTLEKNKAAQLASTAVIQKLEQTLPIVTDRAEKTRRLLERNFVQESEYLQLEQIRIEQHHDLLAERQSLEQLVFAAQEITQRIHAFEAQTRFEVLNEISHLKARVASINEDITKANERHARHYLYAPEAGYVQNLTVNTVGGVVTAAEVLMLIIPEGVQLEVEALLPNKDIGFVQTGMPVSLKLHTFPFTEFGVINGQVRMISEDAVLDEQHGLSYVVHIQMSNDMMNMRDRKVRLLPGMATTAEIKTYQRRVISFFLSPLLRYGNESLRER
ncbi:HlyD family type I secretion periplasmic adaptor subunit [Methylophaga lonarensis]|uniref:HlyD family type I secretion periplasmic adaptor subunit n=1 Tax=Methylophaga lonarensis TaxID=999151 RepID=UPI003D2CE8D2